MTTEGVSTEGASQHVLTQIERDLEYGDFYIRLTHNG